MTRSGNLDGLIADVPGLEAAHLGDFADHLAAGKVSAGAGLGALSSLEVKGLRPARLVHGPPEPGRRQLVEIARVVLLFLRQHAALARADAGPRHLGSLGQRHLGLFAEGSKAHVAHEEGDVQAERPLRLRADDELRAHGVVVGQRTGGELGGEDLEVGPAGEIGERHAHRRNHPVVADLLQAVPGELLDVAVVGLLGRAVDIGVQAQVLVAPVGLRELVVPRRHLGFVHEDRVRAGVDPRAELVQRFLGVVGADAGVEAVVPVVNAADQVVAPD